MEGGWGPSVEREAESATDASGRLANFSVEGQGSRALHEVAGVSIIAAGGPRSR